MAVINVTKETDMYYLTHELRRESWNDNIKDHFNVRNYIDIMRTVGERVFMNVSGIICIKLHNTLSKVYFNSVVVYINTKVFPVTQLKFTRKNMHGHNKNVSMQSFRKQMSTFMISKILHKK